MVKLIFIIVILLLVLILPILFYKLGKTSKSGQGMATTYAGKSLDEKIEELKNEICELEAALPEEIKNNQEKISRLKLDLEKIKRLKTNLN